MRFIIFLVLLLTTQVYGAQTVFNDPSSGACSAGGGNVGNGTCTISQTSYAAKTETVTFTATSVGPAATFTVIGSVSGAMSSITSGSAQSISNGASLPVLIVTLSDGGTPYSIGDTFTVSTTRATEVKKANFDLFTLAQVCSNGCTASSAITGDSFIPSSSSVPTNGMYLSSANTVGISANSTLIATGDTSAWTFNHTTAAGPKFQRTGSGSASGIRIANTDGTWWTGLDSSENFEIRVTDNGGVQAFEGSVAGLVGLGGGVNSASLVNIGEVNGMTGTTQLALRSAFASSSAATSSTGGASLSVTTANSAYTTANLSQLFLNDVTKGAASTVTRHSQIIASMPTQGGTGNAILADSSSFTAGNWGLIFATTNPSLHTGQLNLGASFGDASPKLFIGGNNTSAGADQYGLLNQHVFNSSATSTGTGIRSQVFTANSAFTLGLGRAFSANAASKGAANTITRLVNYYSTIQSAGANNAQFSDNNVFSGSYVFNFADTAASVLAGNISAASFIPSGSTIPTMGMYTRTANRLNWAVNTTKSAELGESSGAAFFILGANSTGNPGVMADSNTGSVSYSGGSGQSSGANMTLFGGTHASQAGDIALRTDSTNRLFYDHSALGWSFLTATNVGVNTSNSGGNVYSYVFNSSNTASSKAESQVEVAGTSAGDAAFIAKISSGNSWGWGLDNSASDSFSLSYNASGAPVLGTSEFMNVTTAGVATFAGQLIGKGTATNDSAAAGFIGEFLSANSAGVAVGSTTSDVNIITLSLTAGDWDCEGTANLGAGLTGLTNYTVVVSKSSAAYDTVTQGGIVQHAPASYTPPGSIFVPTGRRRISQSSTANVYLVGRADYSGGSATWSTSSFLGCRRAR